MSSDTGSDATPALPALPDLRVEQLFLQTVKQHVTIEETEGQPSLLPTSYTNWHRVTNIRWYVQKLTDRRGALLYQLFWEQVLSPIWQGMLWGLAGISFVQARQAFALARAARLQRSSSAAAPARGRTPIIGPLLARIGLGRIAI